MEWFYKVEKTKGSRVYGKERDEIYGLKPLYRMRNIYIYIYIYIILELLCTFP